MQALNFLGGRQAADGSWQEDNAVVENTPPWATPGDPAATLYLTASCSFWLALWNDEEKHALQAAHYLKAHLNAEGSLPSFLHSHWLAAGVWQQLNQEEPAQRVFEYLNGRLVDFAASNLAWLITTLSAAGIAAHHPLMNEAASLLERAQKSDGRWASEDGAVQDVHATLEALRALRLCGRLRINSPL